MIVSSFENPGHAQRGHDGDHEAGRDRDCTASGRSVSEGRQAKGFLVMRGMRAGVREKILRPALQ